MHVKQCLHQVLKGDLTQKPIGRPPTPGALLPLSHLSAPSKPLCKGQRRHLWKRFDCKRGQITLLKPFVGGSWQNYILQNPYSLPIIKLHLVIFFIIQISVLRCPLECKRTLSEQLQWFYLLFSLVWENKELLAKDLNLFISTGRVCIYRYCKSFSIYNHTPLLWRQRSLHEITTPDV